MERQVDETLTDRVRAILNDDPNVAEIRMFGALCFTLNGNMMVCTMKDGSLLVRVGEHGQEAALKRPGAALMAMGGRTMGGFIVVDEAALTDVALGEWIAEATRLVGPMPVKKKDPPKPKKKSG